MRGDFFDRRAYGICRRAGRPMTRCLKQRSAPRRPCGRAFDLQLARALASPTSATRNDGKCRRYRRWSFAPSPIWPQIALPRITRGPDLRNVRARWPRTDRRARRARHATSIRLHASLAGPRPGHLGQSVHDAPGNRFRRPALEARMQRATVSDVANSCEQEGITIGAA